MRLAGMRDLRLALLVVTLALSACTATTESPSEKPSPSPSLMPAALDLLDCDGAPSEMGGIGPFGIVALGESPAAALASWLEDPIFVVPVHNWEAFAAAGDRTLFVYRSARRIKVVAVFSTEQTAPGEGIFTLEELRACPEDEFGPEAIFVNGDRVWTNDAGLILRDGPGPAHCGWQQARMLHMGEGEVLLQYIGDPLGIMPAASLLEPYDGDAVVPADATPSGYRSGDLELWFVPDGRAVFLVGADRAELWPRSDPPMACA